MNGINSIELLRDRLGACADDVSRYALSSVEAISQTEMMIHDSTPTPGSAEKSRESLIVIEANHAVKVHGRLLAEVERSLEQHTRILARFDDKNVEKYAPRLSESLDELLDDIDRLSTDHERLMEVWIVSVASPDKIREVCQLVADTAYKARVLHSSMTDYKMALDGREIEQRDLNPDYQVSHPSNDFRI